MRLGRKNQVTCFFFTRLSLSLDKILTLGNKNKQVCFVLLSLNRIFATQNKEKNEDFRFTKEI